MAGGYFCKTGDWLGARYINQVNDPTVGGQALQGIPAGAPSVAGIYQTQPGDRILLDDATALALSLTSVGTLYGGIYMYVGTLSTATANPAVGTAAFIRVADLGTATPYQVTSDVQPSTTAPAGVLGVFINAITKGNFGWIQVAGVATVLYDSGITSTTVGSAVSARRSAAVASTFDNDLSATIAVTVAQIPAIIGFSLEAAATSTLKRVAMTRFPCRL